MKLCDNCAHAGVCSVKQQIEEKPVLEFPDGKQALFDFEAAMLSCEHHVVGAPQPHPAYPQQHGLVQQVPIYQQPSMVVAPQVHQQFVHPSQYQQPPAGAVPALGSTPPGLPTDLAPAVPEAPPGVFSEEQPIESYTYDGSLAPPIHTPGTNVPGAVQGMAPGLVPGVGNPQSGGVVRRLKLRNLPALPGD